MRSRRLVRLVSRGAALAACLAFSANAAAESGVSDSRVTLPEGPGSLEGLGENVSINPSMGSMSHSVDIAVPAGFGSLTPSLDLSYNSGGGSGIVGIGWALDFPSIERTTFRGLPRYTEADGFATGDGSELVYVRGDDTAEYRARFEGGFVRYTWHDVGGGDEGYWTAEYPDGTVGYFGADSSGSLVAASRVGGADGTFRYNLVEMTDPYGHRTRYHWEALGGTSLCTSVEWVFVEGTARYEAELTYQLRPDAISDGKGGFEELLEHRLSEIAVYTDGVRLRRYTLSYEDIGLSGGASRLAQVQQFGSDDTAYPVVHSFGYSQALSACGDDCADPYVVSLGNVGATPLQGRSTFVDLNGDALPDFVDTNGEGAHQIYLNTWGADGSHSLDGPYASAVATGSAFTLGTGSVQTLDVDGDGFVDLLDSRNGALLRADGGTDWSDVPTTVWDTGDGGIPDLGADFDGSDGELSTIRFIDINNDRRIDILRSTGDEGSNAVDVFLNTGEGFEALPSPMAIGAGFESDRLQLADMNGDGLQDVVQVSADQIRYRLSLGYGVWTAWTTVALDLSDAPLDDVELEDLNGDAVADIVVVQADSVRFWLNQNAGAFDAERTINASAGLSFPTRDTNMSVLFADMNANGTTDVVWISLSGDVTYLELFPLRPNLLTRIENGVGAVTELSYSTNVQMAAMAADEGRPWAYALPYPMTVVEGMDTYNTLTNLHEVTKFRYYDGYFDAGEKQFRGYEVVEVTNEGDASQEWSRSVVVIDTGADDRYFASKVIESAIYALDGGTEIPMQRTETTYADCPVTLPDGIDPLSLDLPVRSICQTAQETVLQERAPESEWVTTRSEMTYDGYGNVTLEANYGVVEIGGGGCDAGQRPSDAFGAPGGVDCLGDEMFARTTYVAPEDNVAGLWITGLPAVVEASALEDFSTSTRSEMFYDGDAFAGLPLGQAAEGFNSRMRVRVSEADDTWIEPSRARRDVHGNSVEELDALGAPSSTEHRTEYTYSDDGLRVERIEVFLEDEEGPYSLRQDVVFDPLWDRPVATTGYVVYAGGTPQTPDNESFWAYDVFGRLVEAVEPGDTFAAPTASYAYDLRAPVSRVISRQSNVLGADEDETTIDCFDGRGRRVQRRVELGEGDYMVGGFSVFNSQGRPVREYFPYRATTGACEEAPPEGVPFVQYRYDAVGRLIETTYPDAPLFGSASVARTEFGPLKTTTFELSDVDGAETPVRRHIDGLGRTVAVERSFEVGVFTPYQTVTFDVFGNVDGYVDADGNRHLETYDEAGRIIAVDDPNRGLLTMEYDAAGNLLSETGEDGVTVAYEYDGLNRQTASYDTSAPLATRIETDYDRSARCGASECTNGAAQLIATEFPLGQDAAGNPRVGGETFGFDGRGRRVRSTHTLEDFTYVTEFTYDNANRFDTITHPDGTVVDYTYDRMGRVIAIEGFVDEVRYDDRGDIAEVVRANGVTETYSRDAMRRVEAYEATGADGLLLGFDTTFTRDGDPLTIRERGVRSAAARADIDLVYDGARRVVGATVQPGTERVEDLLWSLDDLDNVLSATSSRTNSAAHVGDYLYDGVRPNAVTQAGDVAFDYDVVGNMVTRGDDTFAWDHLDRLASATRASVEQAAYYYGAGEAIAMRDAQGSVTHYVGSDFDVQDGVSEAWVRLDGVRIARVERTTLSAMILPDIAVDGGAADGVITAADAWAADATHRGAVNTDAPEAFAAERYLNAATRRVLAEAAPHSTTYVHSDAQGSIVLATDDGGHVIDEQAYYPWGELRVTSNGWLGRYGFTGQEWDDALQMWRFEARVYDPFSGRWISPDPEFATVSADDLEAFGEATTAYAYVANGPTWNVDPDGRRIRKNLRARIHWSRHGRTASKLLQNRFARSVRSKVRNALAYTNQNVVIAALRSNSRSEFRSNIRSEARLNAGLATHPHTNVHSLARRYNRRLLVKAGRLERGTAQMRSLASGDHRAIGNKRNVMLHYAGQVPVVGLAAGAIGYAYRTHQSKVRARHHAAAQALRAASSTARSGLYAQMSNKALAAATY